jgi:hypothetical protein
MAILFFSCKKEKPSILPFLVNHHISCSDLYREGYKRIFGIDVVMIGKKTKDTEIYYEIELPVNKNPEDYIFYNSEEEVLIDTIKRVNKYQKYIDQDALDLTDSIYNIVWGNPKNQIDWIKKEKGYAYWRNYNIRIKESEVKTFRNTIDKKLYKVFDVHSNTGHEHEIEYFKVINLIEKDTFDCYIIKDEQNDYYFSSQILIKNEN